MILHSTDRLRVRAQTVHNEAYKHLQLYRFAPLLSEALFSGMPSRG
jgi:hypothetical protein